MSIYEAFQLSLFVNEYLKENEIDIYIIRSNNQEVYLQ